MKKLLLVSIYILLFSIFHSVSAQQLASDNLTEQFNNSLKLAKDGAPLELYNVGYHYLTGQGVKKDIAEAKRWLKKAEQTQSGAVHYKLGRLLETGDLLEQNLPKAVAHYKYSAQQGDPYGQNNYGLLLVRGLHVEQDIEKGINWLLESAKQNMPQAMLNLGFAYSMRKKGDNNQAQAIEWFKSAANQNVVEAQFQLGNIYRQQGKYKDAVYYLEQAAEANHSDAQLYFAMMFDKGWGVEKNRQQARFWLEKAVENGSEKAKRVLGQK